MDLKEALGWAVVTGVAMEAARLAATRAATKQVRANQGGQPGDEVAAWRSSSAAIWSADPAALAGAVGRKPGDGSSGSAAADRSVAPGFVMTAGQAQT